MGSFSLGVHYRLEQDTSNHVYDSAARPPW